MDLNSYSEVRRTKVLVYGPPKSGKTALVGALAAAGFKLWWFDLEQGIKTLMNPQILPAEYRKNISLFNIPDHRDYPVAIDAIRSLLKGGIKKYCFDHGVSMCPQCAKNASAKWSEQIDLNSFGDKDILVIDSLSQLADSASNKVTRKERIANDDYKESWDDYRTSGNYVKEVLGKIQVSKVNVCVISHDIDVEKDEKKEKIVPVGGTRNASLLTGKYFDEVIYMHVFNKRHVAHNSTTWSPTHLTGGRSSVNMEASGSDGAPTLADIFNGKESPTAKQVAK